MRKSVLTGVLACALVFVVGGQKAEAAPIELLNNQANEPYSVLVALAVNEPELIQTKAIEVAVEPAIETSDVPEEIVHIVGEGESLSDIAEQYETTWQRIFDKNIELENPDYIEVNEELVIPLEDEELEQRELFVPEPVVVAQAQNTSAGSTSRQINAAVERNIARGSSAGNTYVGGQCTWHAKNLRPDLPNNLGNARTWVSRAAAQGIPTGSTPRVGAVAQLKGRNHVAVVQSVNGNGTITISEMNFNGGTYRENIRTVDAGRWNYIY